ncbi:hypothetical protein UlMin_017066 [Ulmus minor]
MAFTSKLFSFLFLATLLSHQITARESQFFSKVTNNNGKDTTRPEVIPVKETTTNPPNQEPNFIPETQNNGHGLYGHETNTGEFTNTNNEAHYTTTFEPYEPPHTIYKPYTTPIGSQHYSTESEENTNNNNYYYNSKNNENNQNNGFSNRLTGRGYTNTDNQNTYRNGDNYQYYNNNGGGNNRYYNAERRGMTSFMEDGKYYYDLNNEDESHP